MWANWSVGWHRKGGSITNDTVGNLLNKIHVRHFLSSNFTMAWLKQKRHDNWLGSDRDNRTFNRWKDLHCCIVGNCKKKSSFASSKLRQFHASQQLVGFVVLGRYMPNDNVFHNHSKSNGRYISVNAAAISTWCKLNLPTSVTFSITIRIKLRADAKRVSPSY